MELLDEIIIIIRLYYDGLNLDNLIKRFEPNLVYIALNSPIYANIRLAIQNERREALNAYNNIDRE